ncbi:MAG: DUF805 domain-containing protein [Saprospiraceae bacterium]
MEMIDYFKLAFEKYADFKTRSNKSEYWWFVLAYLILGLILGALLFIGLSLESTPIIYLMGGLMALIGLALFIPSLAIAVRRLHDTGKSGWWYLISLIPYIGGIVLIFFLASKSQAGANKWGPEIGSSGNDLKDSLVNFD